LYLKYFRYHLTCIVFSALQFKVDKESIMKKNIIIAAIAASVLTSSLVASDANCTTPLKERDFSVKVTQEYKGVSAQELFDQSEKVKKVKPALIKEIKKYTKMLDASEEAYSGTTTVDRIIDEVCSLKDPLWTAMSSNQKTLMLGIDGTPNPYIKKTAHNADVTVLKSKLAATETALANTKKELTAAYQSADRSVINDYNTKITALKQKHAREVAALQRQVNNQEVVLTELTASAHSVGVYNVEKFHGFTTIDFDNGETGICSSGVHLDVATGPVNLYAVCIVDAGHIDGNDNARIYEGYSTDDSDRIDFVRLPYTIRTKNVDARLKYYNAPNSVRKGLRNGPAYQSAIRYSGGDVITSDPMPYNNTPVARKAKTKTKVQKDPLKVLVVNGDANPVKTEEVKEESSSWWK